MPIIHIVLFEFKPTIRREVVVDVCASSVDRGLQYSQADYLTGVQTHARIAR